MPPRPLKTLLSYHYALITLIPFLLIIFVSILVLYPLQKRQIETRHQETAFAIDEKISSFLHAQVAEISDVSSRELHEKNIQALLDGAVSKSESLNALYLLSPSGIIQKVGLYFPHEDNLHRDLELVDMSQSDIFKKVSLKKKPVWSDIFLSIVTGGQAIAYAVPKGDRYLVGEVSLHEICKYLQRISPSQESLILVADQKGQVIADKDGQYSFRQFNVSNLQLIQAASAHQHTLTDSLRFDGVDYIATVSNIGSLGWRSLLATQKETAYDDAYKIIKIILAGLFGSLFLAGLSSKLLIGKISAQFGTLALHTREIAAEVEKSEWAQGDILEFNQIAGSLQQMADILKEREAAILDGLTYIKMDKVRFECLYELSGKEGCSEKEIFDYALEAAVKITGSSIGYIFLLNDDETELTLHSWSKGVMAECSVASQPVHYQVAETGLWGESVRQRRAVVINDYTVTNLAKRGCPEGHVPIKRHLNLPIFYQGRIVLLVGVGNKEAEYTDEDVHQLNLLLDATWILIQKKRGELLLHESEERSLQMFQQNDDALIFFNLPSLTPLEANSAACTMLGFDQQDIRRVSVRRFLDRAGLKSLSAAIRAKQSDFIIDRLSCRRLDGFCFVVSMRGRVLRLKDQHVLLCSLRDMTAKIKLEEEMKAAQAKLILANKMSALGLLVSSIAHEINNPNQSVGMNAFIISRVWRDVATLMEKCHGSDESFLVDGVAFGEMKQIVPQMIDAITQGSQRIDNYIQRLMGFVKDGKGGLDAVVDVNSAIENVVSILWYQIRSGTNRFRTELTARRPLVCGNMQQIEQVIINLIANALQSLSAPDNAVIVATELSADGSEVIITVQDEGRGMKRATLEKIAEPFFSTRQNEGGTGLGVYITANIVKDHRGTIVYDSAPGRGTTVTIRLPAIHTDNQESLSHE